MSAGEECVCSRSSELVVIVCFASGCVCSNGVSQGLQIETVAKVGVQVGQKGTGRSSPDMGVVS